MKPQFEAERGQVGRHGVVRDSQVHEQVAGGRDLICAEARIPVQGDHPFTHKRTRREYRVSLLPVAEKKDIAEIDEILPAVADAVREVSY